MYCGYVTTLKNVRPHPNADRLQLADCFGNTVCVGLNEVEGVIGVYFPVDGQLSVEFCQVHDLVRRKDENGNPCGGYLDPEKRNIRALKLRGEKSDGLFMPFSCLAYTGVNLDDVNIGDTITVVNGHDICQKYIPKSKNREHKANVGGTKVKKRNDPVAPLFQEHKDTEQLAYNLNAFKPGDEIEISLKMHGTSQRTSYTKVLKGYERTLWDRIFRRQGTPIYDWGYISGTRRTVLENFEGGFYGSNEFREQHAKAFAGKLWKGETVYYEVVGFTHTGTPIMSTCDNKRVSDKEFVKQYGKETVFSYGCHPNGWSNTSDGYNLGRCEPQSDIYVYRMTMTNEDGQVVEYTPEFMRYRCEQMGVKTVPVFHRVILQGLSEDWDLGEAVQQLAEQYYDGPDPIGKTHVREGVVVRILNRPTFTAYKHKNFSFKVLEGIAKDVADAPDMEEASGLEEELGET
jgi:hypothetical protein